MTVESGHLCRIKESEFRERWDDAARGLGEMELVKRDLIDELTTKCGYG